MTDIRLIWFGLVVSALVSINEVNLHRAWLVLEWMTVSRVQPTVRGKSISVYNQSPRSNQPGHPSVGRRNEYQPKGSDVLRLGRKGRYGSCVGGPLANTGHIRALKSTLLYFFTFRYSKDAPRHQNEVYRSRLSNVRALNRTDRQTHKKTRLKVYYHGAYTGGSNFHSTIILNFLILKSAQNLNRCCWIRQRSV